MVFISICLSITLLRSPDYRVALTEKRKSAGTMVVDRNSRILRLEPNEQGEYMIWLMHDQIPDLVKNAFIAAEDKRFYHHFGFDPIATMRAIYSYMISGKIVSGASTISQQVVRMLEPRPRNLKSKFIEFCCAIRLEWQLSKDEILELNLNLAPMGGYLKGVGIASTVYYNKDLKMLSISEAAALAALPRSPSRFDPTKPQGKDLLIKEKDRIIDRMVSCGFISLEEANRNKGSQIRFRKRRIPREASHFTELALSKNQNRRKFVKTTLDHDVQKNLQEILVSHETRLAGKGIKQAAAIIVSVKDLEILSLMGSIRYGMTNGGYNNGAISMRSAGSTLKPFLYSEAFTDGYLVSSIIPDTSKTFKTPIGDYIPLNANRIEHGPVTLREALGSSLNLAAVKTIETIGIRKFFELLEQLELVNNRTKNYQQYGYGIAIGNLEVKLFDLVQAYACLASKGNFGRLRIFLDEPIIRRRVVEPQIAFKITQILSDHNARILMFGNPHFFDFGFPVAVKTGTSDGYRDAWAIAYTSDYVIGIWAGNFDGRPSSGLSGANACGPILKDVISNLYGSKNVQIKRDFLATPFVEDNFLRDDIVFLDAEYAGWIHKRELNLGVGRFRLKQIQDSRNSNEWEKNTQQPGIPYGPNRRARISITSPHDGDRFVMPPDNNLQIALKAVPQFVVPYIIWVVDGVEVARTDAPYEFYWRAGSGNHKILAVTPEQDAAKIEIHVD